MPHRLILPDADLRARYAAGHSTTMLARHYSCSPTTVANRLRASGVVLRNARFAAAAIDAALLRRVYLDERRSITAIAVYFGVSTSTIGNKRRQYGIPPRSRQRERELAGAFAREL